MFQSQSPRFFLKCPKRARDDNFSQMLSRARDDHFKNKCPDLMWFNQFSALDIAISMIQQHFIKLTLNVHVSK